MKPEDVKALKFPEGTNFLLNEAGDAPIVKLPSGTFVNWFGGAPFRWTGNFAMASSCTREEWDEIVIASLSRSKPT